MQGRHPDDELWRRAQQGNPAAFAALQRRYEALVRAELRKRLYYASEDDLQDLAQNVWKAVWTALARFRGGSTFATWLVGIVKNVAFEWLRRSKRQEQTLAEAVREMSARGAEPEESGITEQIAVHQAIKKLPENEREVIYLRYFEQLTDEQIAGRLQTPLGTIKSRIRAGITRLRAILQDGEGEKT